MQFRLVERNELPLAWRQNPSTPVQLAAAAAQAGLDTRGIDMSALKSCVVFSAPQCKAAMEYQQMVSCSAQPVDPTKQWVSIAIQHPAPWAQGQLSRGQPSSVRDWLLALRADGHPPFWALARSFYN